MIEKLFDTLFSQYGVFILPACYFFYQDHLDRKFRRQKEEKELELDSEIYDLKERIKSLENRE